LFFIQILKIKKNALFCIGNFLLLGSSFRKKLQNYSGNCWET